MPGKNGAQSPWERLHTTHLAAARMLGASPVPSPSTPNRSSAHTHTAGPRNSARKSRPDEGNRNESIASEDMEEDSELQQQVRAMSQQVALLSQRQMSKIKRGDYDDSESLADSLAWDSVSTTSTPPQHRFNRRGKEVRDMLKYSKERNSVDLETKGAWIESLRSEALESPISPQSSLLSSRNSSRRNSTTRSSQAGRSRKVLDEGIGEAFGTKAMELKFKEIRDAVRAAQVEPRVDTLKEQVADLLFICETFMSSNKECRKQRKQAVDAMHSMRKDMERTDTKSAKLRLRVQELDLQNRELVGHNRELFEQLNTAIDVALTREKISERQRELSRKMAAASYVASPPRADRSLDTDDLDPEDEDTLQPRDEERARLRHREQQQEAAARAERGARDQLLADEKFLNLDKFQGLASAGTHRSRSPPPSRTRVQRTRHDDVDELFSVSESEDE